MKGLLAKDVALFMQRKKSFIFIAAWAVVMCFAIDDGGSFVLGWITIIVSMFAVSSITYDEYDNCYPFLMSLPVTPKIYAVEKYVFGFICGIVSWVFGAAIYMIQGLVTKSLGNPAEAILTMLAFIPIFVLFNDISLPIDLKFGTEKGRTYILIFMAAVFGIVFIIGKYLRPDLAQLNLEEITGPVFVGGLFLVSAIATAISVALSIGIMNKKEF